MLYEVAMKYLAFCSIEKDRKDKVANPKGFATQHRLGSKGLTWCSVSYYLRITKFTGIYKLISLGNSGCRLQLSYPT